MSTKTTFKRIALVAVAALGFGVLSVAPSQAAAGDTTVTFTTGTSPTTKPIAGSAVQIPMNAAITVDADRTGEVAGERAIWVASITKPANSNLAVESITASIANNTIDTQTGFVEVETSSASSSSMRVKLTYTDEVAAASAETLTVFSFTPDVPGYYTLTFAQTAAAGVAKVGALPGVLGINVSGAAIVQSATGLGKSSGTQLLGRQSAVAFYLPAGSTAASRYEISSTGASIISMQTLPTLLNAKDATSTSNNAVYASTAGITKKNGSDFSGGASYAGQGTTTGVILASTPAITDGFVVFTNSAAAATVVISVKSVDPVTGELTNVSSATVTYAAAVVPDTKADATSTSILAKGAIANSAQILDSATVSAAKTAGTQAGTIYVTQKSAIATAVPAESMTVSITGPGLLGSGAAHTAAATGRSLIVKNGDYITVWPDGTSGEATITIVAATSGVTLGVEKITFFDNTPASAAVTVSKTHVLAGTGSVDGVFLVVVKDASGNAVTNIASLTGAPTDTATTQLVGGAATCSTTYSTTKLGYICSVVGKSATKFGKVNYTFVATASDAAETELKATADVTFSFGVAKTVEVTGPTTAGYGEEITLTFTAKDENGLPVADQTYEGSAANGTTGGIFWNTTTVPVYVGSGFAPFNSGETITTVSGVATKKITTPTAGAVASATWTLAGTGLISSGAVDKSIGNTKVVYSVALNNPGVDAATDAANEATDAANAATDAALAAAEAADAATSAAQEASDAVAALSESVTKLIAGLQAQIKSLASVVAKIAKKVKA